MAIKRGNEIPTIDCELITVKAKDSDVEIGLNTASKIAVSPQIETQDAVKLIVKARLIAQKNQTNTMTGTSITLTDNVFNVELVKLLQGGTIKYWEDAEKKTMVDTDQGFGVAMYTPPLVGDEQLGEVFTLQAYTAVYNAAGLITKYEKITYPNCQGVPVSLSSEDGVFRVPEYTINSAPDKGEAPYVIEYVFELPTLE